MACRCVGLSGERLDEVCERRPLLLFIRGSPRPFHAALQAIRDRNWNLPSLRLIFYVQATGCQWCALSKDDSPWIQDRVEAKALLVRLFMRFECLKPIFADGSYSGRLINRALSLFGWNTQAIKRCRQRICTVWPKRWIMKRTFVWMGQPCSAEAFVKTACIRRMVRLLG